MRVDLVHLEQASAAESRYTCTSTIFCVDSLPLRIRTRTSVLYSEGKGPPSAMGYHNGLQEVILLHCEHGYSSSHLYFLARHGSHALAALSRLRDLLDPVPATPLFDDMSFDFLWSSGPCKSCGRIVDFSQADPMISRRQGSHGISRCRRKKNPGGRLGVGKIVVTAPQTDVIKRALRLQ